MDKIGGTGRGVTSCARAIKEYVISLFVLLSAGRSIGLAVRPSIHPSVRFSSVDG